VRDVRLQTPRKAGALPFGPMTVIALVRQRGKSSWPRGGQGFHLGWCPWPRWQLDANERELAFRTGNAPSQQT
jgi:hypothetical protein